MNWFQFMSKFNCKSQKRLRAASAAADAVNAAARWLAPLVVAAVFAGSLAAITGAAGVSGAAQMAKSLRALPIPPAPVLNSSFFSGVPGQACTP